MRVLGLNGVYSRSHDASACLVDGQEIVAYAEEERFLRSKRALDKPPHNAINFCLESSGIDINSFDAITYGWQADEKRAADLLPLAQLSKLKVEIPVTQVAHHEAHAASVFYTSGFSEAAVLVMDGAGEHESITIWQGSKATGLEKRASFGIERSLGYLYGAISKFCGLGTFGAGKLMGLAPYGEARYIEVIRAAYEGTKLPKHVLPDLQKAFFESVFGQLKAAGFNPAEIDYQYDAVSAKVLATPQLLTSHKDLAASLQSFLEQKAIELTRLAKMSTGADYLCLAGGVAMNCVTNSLIQNSGLFKDVFVQPACEDSGVALGSVLALTQERVELSTAYTGPAFSDEEIGGILGRLGIRAVVYDDISTKGAELLAKGDVIGWFQQGAEFGPRALGARSILAHPGTVEMRDRVNKIKSRELWRPFGPSVAEERADELLYDPHESKYMLRSFRVKEDWSAKLPAITHVDGTTRPQTVERDDNPRFYDLIKAFEQLTGLPAVLNTSFNSHGEPMVATPEDALRTYYSTCLGALILGNHLLVKQAT